MDPLPDAPLPRRRLPRPEREARMLDAAEEVFGERGFRGASVEEIAERSGITKALVYQYFDSKELLYEACVERARARLFDEIGIAVARVPPGPAQLRVFVEVYFDGLERHRGAWFQLYGEASAPAVNRMRQRNAEVIAAMLRDAFEAGGNVVPHRDTEALAHTLVGAGEQLGRWWDADDDIPKEDAVEALVTVAQGAIAAVVTGARERR